MRSWKKRTVTTVSIFLLLLIVPLMSLANNFGTSSDDDNVSIVLFRACHGGQWWKIETNLITLLFSADEKKPMFIWWYSNDTDNIFVVKYKGLIEYMMLDHPSYLRKYHTDNQTMRPLVEDRYVTLAEQKAYDRPCLHWRARWLGVREEMKKIIGEYMGGLLGLHPACMLFSTCQWNLTHLFKVTTKDRGSYISFNFTLAEAPTIFGFAENNVMIRCKFYATGSTENFYNVYNHTLCPGELKIDLVVKEWKWNTDKLEVLYNIMKRKYGFPPPEIRAGLALWTDIEYAKIGDFPIAQQDATSISDLVEAKAKAFDMIIADRRVQAQENRTAMDNDEIPIAFRDSIPEHCRMRFAKGSQILQGFFDFVDTAVVINATGDVDPIKVSASYISAGNRLRLFLGYPHFSNCTLHHDPSIGVETVAPWIPTHLLIMLIGATSLIVITVAAGKIRDKTFDIVSVK